jgi:putative phosphoesterase
MRIAIISDIHANLVAFQTVLADIEQQHVDQMVCLGDVAANGPQPLPVIQRLRELACPVVCGNTDEWFTVPQTYDPSSAKERRLMAIREWALNQLSAEDIDFIHSFRPRVAIPLEDGKRLLGFHGSPLSNRHTIWATTPEDELIRMFGDYEGDVMVGGHTHVQLLRQIHDWVLMNPGSVGSAMAGSTTPEQIRRAPHSEYAILESRGAGLVIEFRRVPLDVAAVVRAARESMMPFMEEWVGEWPTP